MIYEILLNLFYKLLPTINLFSKFVVISVTISVIFLERIEFKEMRKISLVFMMIMTFILQAESQSVFTSVPIVNGKVVFQQFVHADQALSSDQRYSLLYKWGKDNYSGNPLLAGIRFDDKNKSITVSSKVELLLPQNSDGVREKVIMNYRFDASITNAGLSLIIRDISYQNVQTKGPSLFPKTFSAENTITQTAISAASQSEKEFKVNTQKSTLYFLNELYEEISGVFALNE